MLKNMVRELPAHAQASTVLVYVDLQIILTPCFLLVLFVNRIIYTLNTFALKMLQRCIISKIYIKN